MLALKQPVFNEKMKEEMERLELYRLLGEGYKAMREGRVSPTEDVVKRMEQRRTDRRG